MFGTKVGLGSLLWGKKHLVLSVTTFSLKNVVWVLVTVLAKSIWKVFWRGQLHLRMRVFNINVKDDVLKDHVSKTIAERLT